MDHSLKIIALEFFVEYGMVTTCAWNNSPIDGTDITSSVPVIRRELKFPMDINIGKLPYVIDSPSESVVVYLRHIKNNVEFSRQLLSCLLDDR